MVQGAPPLHGNLRLLKRFGVTVRDHTNNVVPTLTGGKSPVTSSLVPRPLPPKERPGTHCLHTRTA